MRRSRKLLFVAVISLCGLIAVEVLARAVLRRRPALETMRQRLAGEPVASFQNCVGQPYLVYAPLPGYAPGGTVDHNAQGFRGAAVESRKPVGVVRVLCLGGSTTYGWTVASAAEAYPAQLERLLAARKPPSVARVEVLNAGLPFGTSAEMLTHYLFKFHYFRPDLVIVNEGGNDAFALSGKYYQPDYSHWRRQPCLPEPLPPHSRWLLRSRTAAMVWMWLALGNQAEAVTSITRSDDTPPLARWFPEVGPVAPGRRQLESRDLAFDHNIRSLLRAVEADGARALLVPFRAAPGSKYGPTLRRWTDRNEQVLRALAEEYQLPLAPFPASVITPGNWTDHCHLNARGESEKAAHIVDHAAAALGWPLP